MLIKQYIAEVRWVDDEVLEAARANGVDIAVASPESLESFRPPSRLDNALVEIRNKFARLLPDLPEETGKRLLNRLKNSGKFAKLFR